MVAVSVRRIIENSPQTLSQYKFGHSTRSNDRFCGRKCKTHQVDQFELKYMRNIVDSSDWMLYFAPIQVKVPVTIFLREEIIGNSLYYKHYVFVLKLKINIPNSQSTILHVSTTSQYLPITNLNELTSKTKQTKKGYQTDQCALHLRPTRPTKPFLCMQIIIIHIICEAENRPTQLQQFILN